MTPLDAGRPGHSRRAPKWILIGAAAALVVMVAAVALFVLLGGGERTVRLEVSADGTEVARIGYATRERSFGLRPQTDGTELPWSTELEVPEGPGGVSLSVMNARPGSGTVSCKLLHGDEVVSEVTTPLVADCAARSEDLFGD